MTAVTLPVPAIRLETPSRRAAGEGEWVIDPSTSSAEFSTRLGFGRHATGRFTNITGVVSLHANGDSVIGIVVDVVTLTVDNEQTQRRIAGPNYLDLARHPFWTLVSERIDA